MAEREARKQSRWVRALPVGLLGVVVGFGFGLVVSAFAGSQSDTLWGGLPVFIALVTGFLSYMFGALVIETMGDLAGRIFGGSNVGTKREYSAAQALAVRGQYEAAVAAYEAAAAEYPADPAPLIRGAAVLAEGLEDYTAAVAWLQRARGIEQLRPEADVAIAQKLVDLYDGPLEAPRKALPELARIIEAYPDTPAGAWADRRLAQLKADVRKDAKGPDAPDPDPRPGPSNSDPTI